MLWDGRIVIFTNSKSRIPELEKNVSLQYILKTDGFGDKPLASIEAKIAQYFFTPGASAMYTYDFSIDWEHTIVLEDIVPAEAEITYPVCLAGKHACPPEDGSEYKPHDFDPKSVTFADINMLS